MPRPLDLNGKQFGNWTVIQKAERKGDKAYWLCGCGCGEIKKVQATSLMNGSSVSCGKCDFSITKFVGEPKVCDICGKTFQTVRYGHGRRFCYECSPLNGRGAKSITSIRKAIKRALVNYKGGCCEVCGYNKSLVALHFHHRNPQEKDFSISKNVNLGNFDMNGYYDEVNKCMLLCANCHAEIHENLER